MRAEMATQPNPLMSVRQYLKLLKGSDVRYEYCGGEAVAMAGGSARHNRINFNLAGILWPQLKDTGCTASSSDQLVLEESQAHYMFPDLVIHCKEARMARMGIAALLDPVVIFEVLSPSTERVDRTSKFESYSRMESLKHLLFVHQNTMLVEHHFRESAKEAWRVEHLFRGDGVLRLPPVGAELNVANMYSGIELEESAALDIES
jgi:Uma2 family endonuclease